MNTRIPASLMRQIAYLGVMLVLVCAPLALNSAHGIPTWSVAHAAEDGGVAAAGTTAASGKKPPAEGTACTDSALLCLVNAGISNAFSFTFGGIINILVSAIILLGTYFLNVAAYFFNVLVERTIIQFGSLDPGHGVLTQGVMDGINTAWSAFRDIANILIIGFFVFLTINIILGTREYGDKKLIARVLIVAILINFSLLFTKVVIDISNFTATQFYNAGLSSNSAATQTATGITSAPDGISGRLIGYMGVASYAQTVTALDNVRQADGIPMMMLYAIASLIVLLGAAAVLLYGCFILASRAILLVFLMITASLAFASYLIPKFSDSQFGWRAWWNALIGNAVLAPILMLLLWATLLVAQSLKGNGKLGEVLTNPASAAGMSSLFSYIIVLGLLFATFKVASSLSHSIGGFNWASVVPAISIAAGSRLAGVVGQRYSAKLGNVLQQAPARLQIPQGRIANTFTGAANAFQNLSRRPLNAMNTNVVGKTVAKQVQRTGLTQTKLANMFGSGGIVTSAAQKSAAAAIKAAASASTATTGAGAGQGQQQGAQAAQPQQTPAGGGAAGGESKEVAEAVKELQEETRNASQQQITTLERTGAEHARALAEVAGKVDKAGTAIEMKAVETAEQQQKREIAAREENYESQRKGTMRTEGVKIEGARELANVAAQERLTHVRTQINPATAATQAPPTQPSRQDMAPLSASTQPTVDEQVVAQSWKKNTLPGVRLRDQIGKIANGTPKNIGAPVAGTQAAVGQKTPEPIPPKAA